MQKTLWSIVALLMLAGCARSPQDVLTDVSTAIGATDLKTIQYSGSGYIYALGQSYRANEPWPKFNLKSYSRLVDYEKGAMREEDVRTQFENPPRGGGLQPVIGERRTVAFLSGDSAWNVGADGAAAPAPAAVEERQVQLAITPHGWVKAAMTANPAMESRTVDGQQVTVVSFTVKGKYKVNGFVNSENVLEKVETWIPNPVLGDMLVETRYSDYRDFSGVKFPARIVQMQGGHPTLDITVSSVQPNPAANIAVPENARTATVPPVRVESQELVDGVWLLAGGSHNSVAVEFQDHVVMIEGPQDEERSEAVIAEAKKLLPDKPIRYLVNTHHHFDHSGGMRTYVDEGATLITHESNKPYFEQAFLAPRTLRPDRMSRSTAHATFQTMTDKYVLTDGMRTMELHLTEDSGHNAGLIMVYLPRERLLIEADSYSSAGPGAPLPGAVSTLGVNLYENIERLGLAVQRIVPIHGRAVPLDDLRRAIGKTS